MAPLEPAESAVGASELEALRLCSSSSHSCLNLWSSTDSSSAWCACPLAVPVEGEDTVISLERDTTQSGI